MEIDKITTLEQAIKWFEGSIIDDDDFHRNECPDCAANRFALQALHAQQAREAEPKALTLELINELLAKLEKEKEIISKEDGKDYAHLTFKDGREHTLMRVKAWANTRLKRSYDRPKEPPHET